MCHVSGLGGRRLFHTPSDFAAVLIGLDGNALHVDPRGRRIFMIERLLCLNETAGLFGDDARVGVPRLMQMHVLKARRRRILLQVIGEGS